VFQIQEVRKVRKDFQKITSLSGQMLIKARNSEWDDLLEIESERSALMAAFFSKPLAGLAKHYVAEGIRLILETDREVMELSAARRKVLRSSLSKMGKGRNAVQAYATSV